MKFIVKLFPEIMIKGQPVKKKMILRLSDNLRVLLRRVDPAVAVAHFWDKIEIHTTQPFVEKVRVVLKQTPGIEQVLEVVQYNTGVDFLTIAQKVALHAVPMIADKTFVVRAKRSGHHAFTSCDLQRFVGEHLCVVGESLGVDLHHPQVTVQFELHQDAINVITDRYPGLGGYPLGGQGDVLSLMSGGFDSTIASYMTMKRGIKTHFVFFNLGGIAHELGVKQVALYLWSQFGASHRVSFITVPFEEVVSEIFRSTHESYMGVILKRLMLTAAEQIANKMDIEVLVTGESVAQVSSQTLRNLAVIDVVTTKLVLRPLATFNKVEIMAMADTIGTREFAQSMPEYCGVISKNPVVNASFERVAREAAKFDMSVLQAAVDGAVTIAVDKIVEDVQQSQYAPVIYDLNEALEPIVVIDIRRPDEVSAAPLGLSGALSIPFYELKTAFKALDQTRRYALYCEKGVMSQLHAHYLKDLGFDSVCVYRPHWALSWALIFLRVLRV